MVTLETERLMVRNFKASDWQALHAMVTEYESSEVAAYDHPWPTSPQEIQGIAGWFAGGDSFLAVCLKDTGRFIGFVALNPEGQEDLREYNLGYIFNSEDRGQGYATEACRAVLDRAFEQLQAVRVVSGTAAANAPSCRLLGRLGFKKTAESMGAFRNGEDGQPLQFLGLTYALSRAEWEAARSTHA